MFSILYWRSIGIHALLAMAFGITEFSASGNLIPAYATCAKVSGEIICYFKASEKPMVWDEARRLCSSLNSTLPVIRNRNDQDAVAGYLGSHMNTSLVWTAGKHAYSKWTWINGEPLKESSQEYAEQLLENEINVGEQDYAAFQTDCKFAALAFFNELPYICQYKDRPTYCNSSSDIDVNDKCITLSNDSLTWSEARDQCLRTNGYLAIIDDDAHGLLKKLALNQSYWIGLRKNKSWRWTLNDNAESNDEIKYTYWDNEFSTDGECIFIDAPEGKWKAVGCNQPREVVCQRGQGVTSPATTTIQTRVDSFTLFAAVGAGIVIIICIIVITFFVLRTKKGGNRQTMLSDSSPQNKREEFDARITNTPVYTSVNESANAPVTTSDDIRGVYAEIPMSTANQSEDGATNQQPGIVYASLEFKGDPTNLEPDETRANTTSPIKVGPLGDIYAMPDAKAHAVTSPGNESASQTVKVNPQGEVVYANLQAEILGKEQASEEHDHTK